MAFTLHCISTQPQWFPVIQLAIREEYCMDGLREKQMIVRTCFFFKTVTVFKLRLNNK